MYKTFMLIQQNSVILQVWPANFNGREVGPGRVPTGHQL
jgi:hypothetical protein